MSENIQVTPNTPDFSEQEQIRRDKLQTLMDNGQNPYLINMTLPTKAIRFWPIMKRWRARRLLWRAA